MLGRNQRCFAAPEHVDHQWRLDFQGYPFDLCKRLWRFHKNHVRPGLGIGVPPFNRRVQPKNSPSVCPGDNEQSAVATCFHRGLNFLDHLRAADHLLAFVMTAAFGFHLVLNMQGRRTGARIRPNRPNDVQGIPIARVGIHNKRESGDCANLFQPLLHFREGDQANIGIAHTARDGTAAHIQHRYAGGFGNFG